jgi:hypothetical protein
MEKSETLCNRCLEIFEAAVAGGLPSVIKGPIGPWIHCHHEKEERICCGSWRLFSKYGNKDLHFCPVCGRKL